MKYHCFACGKEYSIEAKIFRCTCGGFLVVEGQKPFPLEELNRRDSTIWRYKGAFGLPEDVNPVSLGEGLTPLIKRWVDRVPVFLKLDFLQPTGSFKDRGASVILSLVKYIGVTSVVEDSSGNSGAAVSAYSAAAGVKCTVFVPSYTPDEKLIQIKMYGADVVKVPGKRQDANDAAIKASENSYYSSHLWNPYFAMGFQSAAFEIWEELGREVPSMAVVPIASGGLLEGIYQGFRSLYLWGYTKKIPKIVGVQAERCSPIHTAFEQGLNDFAEIDAQITVAEGIAVQKPPRAKAVLAAIRDTAGFTVSVSEDEIISATWLLFSMGIYVEPTSASTLAGWMKIDQHERENAVLVLTGNGLKETAKLGKIFANRISN